MNRTILSFAVFFWIEEICHFGWHITPQSDAELIADGICFLLFALAVLAGRGQ